MNNRSDVTTADGLTIDRARRGESDSLADLWTIYQPQLLRMLRAQGRTAAEDIASQVWIEVRRSLDRFDGDGTAFRSWIFTIAGRRAIDATRQAYRRAEVPMSSFEPALATTRSADPIDDSLDGVLALLGTLRPVAAEVVMLRVVHDLPVSQVAAITGQTEANVRVVLHRALERLRGSIGAGGSLVDALAPDVRMA